jgi:hypothetical protein
LIPHGEAGSSPVTAVFGIAIFLAFLLFASQVLTHLYATSTVSAAAFDTARRLAAEGAPCTDANASAIAGSVLGGYAAQATTTCRETADQVTVTIRGPSPARALASGFRGSSLDAIDRSASVRVETFR